jgi:hypothetical protein
MHEDMRMVQLKNKQQDLTTDRDCQTAPPLLQRCACSMWRVFIAIR